MGEIGLDGLDLSHLSDLIELMPLEVFDSLGVLVSLKEIAGVTQTGPVIQHYLKLVFSSLNRLLEHLLKFLTHPVVVL